MANEIVILGEVTAVQVFGTDAGAEPIIKKIEDEVRTYALDVTTPSGRDEIKSVAHKVARSKTTLDDMGKTLVEEARATVDAVNGERKLVRDRLDALKAEIRPPLTDFENKEKDRVAGHEKALADLKANWVMHPDATSENFCAAVHDVNEFHQGRDWEEFGKAADGVRNEVIATLMESLKGREKYEADQAELARLRAETEAREKKEREDAIAKEAADRAKKQAEEEAERVAKAESERVQAEREALEKEARDRELALEKQAQAEREAREKAEQDAADAKVAEKQAKADAEKAALEATEQEKRRAYDAALREEEEAKLREQNKAHRAKINNDAAAALVAAGLSEDLAKAAVVAIAKREIPHVTISY
jgi:hypothetical protein